MITEEELVELNKCSIEKVMNEKIFKKSFKNNE